MSLTEEAGNITVVDMDEYFKLYSVIEIFLNSNFTNKRRRLY
jgi:hypothetical protein